MRLSILTGNPSPREALQALLDAAADGIVLVDHAGEIQVFNRSAEMLFGYQAAEIVGRNLGTLMNDPDRAAHDVATRVSDLVGRGRTISARRKDGSVFPAFLSIGAVAGSEPPAFVGFVRDLTAQQQAEQETLRLRERLMHVSRLTTVAEMVSGIAHELNQPLAAIATYAHACDRLIGVAAPDVAEIQDALQRIADQAVRAGSIIHRLRGLGQTDASEYEFADVNAVICELADLIQNDARARGVSYRADLAPNLPLVRMKRAQIQQTVLNLVCNALEALAPPQLQAREVIVRSRLTPTRAVEITVCDNGPGVDSQTVSRMFDPFYTTKADCAGLGLPISRTIVHAHGGSLKYLPEMAAGACFAIQLPA
jgi:two-component system sensor kinase FixL